jgi:hypothetical protein
MRGSGTVTTNISRIVIVLDCEMHRIVFDNELETLPDL